jgi:hypothetical protein
MKNVTLLLCCLLLAGVAQAQQFPVDTLIKNGPVNRRINLVFVGDGYQASEMNTYLADVNRSVSSIFRQEPFRQYREYFNVFAVRVPSAQSGTTHPRTASDCGSSTLPVGAPTTYFRTTFDNAGVHRAIVTRGQSELASVLAASFPLYTIPVVMVNSPEYGGTGGSNITLSANVTAPETMIHEMGHSLANLGDEYWAGQQFASERANRTQPAVVGSVRWQSWIGTNNVGTYPHMEDPTWSRPHQNCKMRFLNSAFCNVCIETIIESIHNRTRGLQSFSPTAFTLNNITQDVQFDVDVLKPTPNTMRVTWLRDGVPFGGNVESVTVPRALLATGSHVIRAEITDTTTQSRSITHRNAHRYVVEWDITNTVTGTKLATSSAEYKIETFPNPVDDVLNLSYSLSKATDVRLTVVDAAGRRVKTLTRDRQAAGTYTYQLRTDDLNLRQAGVYNLLLEINGMPFNRQIVKQ